MALRSENSGGGLRRWMGSRRGCFVVGGAAVLSSVLYVLYRYYRSRRDNDLCKDEGFEDTIKVGNFTSLHCVCHGSSPPVLYPSIRVRTAPPVSVRVWVMVNVSFSLSVTLLRILFCMCPKAEQFQRKDTEFVQ